MPKSFLYVFIFGVALFYTCTGQAQTRPPQSVGDSTRIATVQDSLRQDSIEQVKKKKKIRPDTKWVHPHLLFQHDRHYIRRERPDIGKEPLWDELDEEAGFVQRPGQIGKPYQVFRFGANTRQELQSLWWNPVMGRYNRYMVNPETQASYYDTKTPYVNVQYVQGAKELQLLDITLSQNISPFWNFSAYYKRRQMLGAYSNHTTDHRLLHVNNYFHTFNNRYHLFASVGFNNLKDQLNGGENRTAAFPNDSEAFLKEQARLNLSDAELRQYQRSIFIDQYLHFGKLNDSINSKHLLTFRGAFFGELLNQRYADIAIDTFYLFQNLIPVYPNLAPDSTSLWEEFDTRRLKLLGGASYSYDGNWLKANVNGDVNYQWLNLQQDTLNYRLNQSIFEQNVHGKLFILTPKFELESKLDYRGRSSNLFPTETYLNSTTTYAIPWIRDDYYLVRTPREDSVMVKDSLLTPGSGNDSTLTATPSQLNPRFTPANLSFTYILFSQNPTIFQTYFQSSGSNLYTANPDLRNQQSNQLRLRFFIKGRSNIIRADTIKPNFLAITGFISRFNRMIYYTRSMEVRQAESTDNLTWFGVELEGRVRFLRKFFAEGRFSFQTGSTNSTEDLAYYATHIPKFYGKASIYYENKDISFAGILRIGIDVSMLTKTRLHTLDPITGEYFPVDYDSPFYIQGDAYFSTQIKRAYIFLKFSHLNDGIGRRGYYTVPFYPSLERTFSLGLNWSFYD